jgi:hypothetical protein
MSQDAAILAIRIRAELAEIGRVVERTQRLAAKAIERGDDDYFDGVALNLHCFYTSIERILEEIAREIDGVVPGGPQWHRDLLVQMSAEVPGIRPMVLQSSSRFCLDEYRGLRHIIRNVYTLNLKPARLQELVVTLPDCYGSLQKDLGAFCNFLEALDNPEAF